MSTPTEAQWAAMSKLVDSFYKRQDAEPFREPVAYKELGLFDYPTIIKKPMDLGTIQKGLKAKNRKYSTLHECAEDVQLVWTNCMTYNADGSDFFVLAHSLQRKWNDKFTKLLQDQGIPLDAGTTAATQTNAQGYVALEDKRAFAKSLYKLTKEDLGRLLMELDQLCPTCLTKNAQEDEMEVNVDLIPKPTMERLKELVHDFLKRSNAAGNDGGSGNAGGSGAPQKKKAKKDGAAAPLS